MRAPARMRMFGEPHKRLRLLRRNLFIIMCYAAEYPMSNDVMRIKQLIMSLIFCCILHQNEKEKENRHQRATVSTEEMSDQVYVPYLDISTFWKYEIKPQKVNTI